MARHFVALVLLIPSLILAQDAPKPTPNGTGKAILFPDGRTVVVLIDQATKRYHLIGVQPIDPKASQAALKTMINTHEVRVELDPGLTIDPTDGVPMAYVYRSADGLFVNHEMIIKGLARIDDRKPFLSLGQFQAAQDEAVASKRGGWADPPKPAIPPLVQAARPDPVKPPELVPDSNYVPSPGDRVQLYDHPDKGDICVVKDTFAYDALIKAALANDRKGIEELRDSERMRLVPSGTHILVIQRISNQFIGQGVPACEVRILDGDLKDQAVWCMSSNVVFFIEKPKTVPTPDPGRIRRPIGKRLR